MLNVEMNTFYQWTQQDDILASSWGIVDSENLDWLETWYWIKLSKKAQEQIQSLPFTVYDIDQSWSDLYIVGNDWTDWYIYEYNTTTELFEERYVLTGNDPDKNTNTSTYSKIKKVFIHDWFMYVIAQDRSSSLLDLHKIWYVWQATFWATEFAYEWDYDYWSFSFITSAPIVSIKDWQFLYIGNWWSVMKITISSTDQKNIFESSVVWMSIHWTRILVYQNDVRVWWIVSYRDWVSSASSANILLWFRPVSVGQKAWADYIYSSDWDTYVGSGYDYQRLIWKIDSKRLNDNSSFQEKFNFTYNDPGTSEDWIDKQIILYRDMMHWTSKDTVPWLYKYWSLVPWLPPWIFKILTIVWTETIISIDLLHFDPILQRIWMFYQTSLGSKIWFIELSSGSTNKDWYFVTQVFRWPPNKENKFTALRITTSSTSWNDYIKVYQRINNASSWELIKTINDSTDEIVRHEITANDNWESLNNKFIDIQFKVEIHNEAQDNDSPICHHMELIYDIIWN